MTGQCKSHCSCLRSCDLTVICAQGVVLMNSEALQSCLYREYAISPLWKNLIMCKACCPHTGTRLEACTQF